MARDAAAAVCYVDTSALIKRYLRETGSEAFEVFCARTEIERVICPLGITEFTSALQRRLRLGNLNARQVALVRQGLIADVASGGWRVIDFESDVFSKANQLLGELGAPLSTLDALHLACALQYGVVHFATADLQLATAARKAKLQVHTF